MLYFVAVADRTVEVDLRGPTPTIDGQPVDARVTSVAGSLLRHLVVAAESHAVYAEPGDRRGRWAVALGGRALEVEVLDERTRTIREMTGGAETETDKVIAAPMPGLVVRVEVEVGQRVVAGQGLVVVEAMKMENELKAPSDGTVASIQVAAGDAVEKSAVLLVLE
ncbi:MAG: acetyl-CoA carboxylase biotin carboxyl carrier protein subunit [Gemmatimonadota bacterium]